MLRLLRVGVSGGRGGPVVAIVASRAASACAPKPKPLLRIDSSLVLVPVHVTNAMGASVTRARAATTSRISRTASNKRVSSFYTDDAPVSLGFLFDTSGSMRTKMKKSAEAAAAFFRTANPDDEFFLIEFNDRAKLTVPFTSAVGRSFISRSRTHVRPAGPP